MRITIKYHLKHSNPRQFNFLDTKHTPPLAWMQLACPHSTVHTSNRCIFSTWAQRVVFTRVTHIGGTAFWTSHKYAVRFVTGLKIGPSISTEQTDGRLLGGFVEMSIALANDADNGGQIHSRVMTVDNELISKCKLCSWLHWIRLIPYV